MTSETKPKAEACALREAAAHVFRQQHVGTHEQDRADARVWMDAYGGGRCRCEKCDRDAERFARRQRP